MKKTKIKLVIFDLDDTLTIGPTIWERIHNEMGTWKSHGDPYWEQFKQGKFGYNAFIRKDVECWKGLKISRVMKAVRKMKFIPNLKSTIKQLKKRKIKTALISSSIEIFADYVSKKFKIDHIHANTLQIKKGCLTGKVALNVPGKAKGRLTKTLINRLKIRKNQVLAVGDSKYDLPMFKQAGKSVTFIDAPASVKQSATNVISKSKIQKILRLI